MKSSQQVFAKFGLTILVLSSATAWAKTHATEGLENNLAFNLEGAAAGGDCHLHENFFAEAQGNTLVLRTKDIGFDLFGQGTRRVACTLAVPVTLPLGFALAAVEQNVTYWARKSAGGSVNGSVAFSAGIASQMAAPVVIDLGEAAIEGTSFFKNDRAPLAASLASCGSPREKIVRVNLVLSGIGSQNSDELHLWWRSDDVQKFNFILVPCAQ